MSLLSPLVSLSEGVGRLFLSLAEGVGHPIEVFLQTITRLHLVPARRRPIAEQLYSGAIQGIHVVLLVGLFIGMIVSIQTGIELMRIGQQDQIWTVVEITLARVIGSFMISTL